MKKSILYFAISFVLQFVWFGLVHPNRGVTLLDMFMFSILFAVMFFLLSEFGSIRRKDKVNDHEARFIHSDDLCIYRPAVSIEPFWSGRYANGYDLCISFSCAHWFRGSIV